MHWVDASERLPEERGKYYAMGINGGMYVARLRYIHIQPEPWWVNERGDTISVAKWIEMEEEDGR